jgi:hypothetical protein
MKRKRSHEIKGLAGRLFTGPHCGPRGVNNIAGAIKVCCAQSSLLPVFIISRDSDALIYATQLESET